MTPGLPILKRGQWYRARRIRDTGIRPGHTLDQKLWEPSVCWLSRNKTIGSHSAKPWKTKTDHSRGGIHLKIEASGGMLVVAHAEHTLAAHWKIVHITNNRMIMLHWQQSYLIHQLPNSWPQVGSIVSEYKDPSTCSLDQFCVLILYEVTLTQSLL